MKLRRYTITSPSLVYAYEIQATLLVAVLELERMGATEYDVDRVASLQPGESYTPSNKAFCVRRTQ